MLAISELKQQLLPALHELGLRDQEIDLYIQGSLLGPTTVAIISDHLGISAPNAYKLIARLEEVGLTTFSQQKGYYRKFIVEPPTSIVERLQKRRRDVEQLAEDVRRKLPDLLASHHQGSAPPVIKTLQGKIPFQRATKQMFEEEGKEILLIGAIDPFVQAVSPEFFADLTRERLEKKIMLRSLLVPSPFAKELQKREKNENREIRFLPQNTVTASMQLSARKAIVWQPNAPLALLIEDESIVQLFRMIFEQLWKGF